MVVCILKHIPQAGSTKEPATRKKSNLIFAALGSGMYFHSPTFSETAKVNRSKELKVVNARNFMLLGLVKR